MKNIIGLMKPCARASSHEWILSASHNLTKRINNLCHICVCIYLPNSLLSPRHLRARVLLYIYCVLYAKRISSKPHKRRAMSSFSVYIANVRTLYWLCLRTGRHQSVIDTRPQIRIKGMCLKIKFNKTLVCNRIHGNVVAARRVSCNYLLSAVLAVKTLALRDRLVGVAEQSMAQCNRELCMSVGAHVAGTNAKPNKQQTIKVVDHACCLSMVYLILVGFGNCSCCFFNVLTT